MTEYNKIIRMSEIARLRRQIEVLQTPARLYRLPERKNRPFRLGGVAYGSNKRTRPRLRPMAEVQGRVSAGFLENARITYKDATPEDVFNWWMEYDVLPGQMTFDDYEEL